MPTVQQTLQAHYDRKVDQFNEAFTQLHDVVLLSEQDCEAMLKVLNEKLPGESSQIGHRLRQVLILSIDVQRVEDALVDLKKA